MQKFESTMQACITGVISVLKKNSSKHVDNILAHLTQALLLASRNFTKKHLVTFVMHCEQPL